MTEPDQVEFNIEVSAQDTSAEDIDRMTRQLLSELREFDAHSAALTKGGTAPAGAKGDPVTIGSIALQVLPAVLPSLIGFIQAWASRGHGRTVKVKARGIEFEGSPEEFQKLMETLEMGRKK